MLRFSHYIVSLILLCSASTAMAINIQNWKTDNGTNVFFVEAHEIPIVDARIMFDAGSSRDGDAFGLAYFTGLMLNEGTSHLSDDEIAQQLEDNGAVLNVQTSSDYTAINLRSLRDDVYFTPASKVFADVLTNPSFPKKSFDRIQQTILQSLKKQKEVPNSIAIKAMLKAIYGDHPYGHTQSGDEKTVSKITLNMLKNFHKQYYTANNATIVIVGDLTPEQAKSWANTIVAKIPLGEKPAPIPLATKQCVEGKHEHIDFKASQNAISMGELGITANSPDYFPLMIGNYIFGGGALNSWLFKQVRDIHGYTYGAYSSFVELKHRGPFLIGLASRNEVADKAISLTQSLLDEFVRDGVSETELENTKQYMTGSFDLTLSSNAQILDQVATIAFFDLPLDYLATYRDNVNAVTKQQIQQAFQKHVDPKRIVTITVGPTKKNDNG